jgi:hypothetical protein
MKVGLLPTDLTRPPPPLLRIDDLGVDVVDVGSLDDLDERELVLLTMKAGEKGPPRSSGDGERRVSASFPSSTLLLD